MSAKVKRHARRARAETPHERAQLDLLLLQMGAIASNKEPWAPRALARRKAAMKEKYSMRPGKPKRPAPLPAAIQARLDRLRVSVTQNNRIAEKKKQRTLAERLKKVREFKVPDSFLDPTDTAILAQLSVQPAEYRNTLGFLYRTWVAYNALHFGGRLKLPIISVTNSSEIPNARATCSLGGTPCQIRFAKRELVLGKGRDQQWVLLHEMLHQYIAQESGPDVAWDEATRGHHAHFAEIANRVGRVLGIPDCAVDPAAGKGAAQYWPHHHL
jgi:hypothetical protein